MGDSEDRKDTDSEDSNLRRTFWVLKSGDHSRGFKSTHRFERMTEVNQLLIIKKSIIYLSRTKEFPVH